MQIKQVSVKDGTVDWRGTKMVTIFGFQQSLIIRDDFKMFYYNFAYKVKIVLKAYEHVISIMQNAKMNILKGRYKRTKTH
jgi:hypothetical protein